MIRKAKASRNPQITRGLCTCSRHLLVAPRLRQRQALGSAHILRKAGKKAKKAAAYGVSQAVAATASSWRQPGRRRIYASIEKKRKRVMAKEPRRKKKNHHGGSRAAGRGYDVSIA